MLQYTDLNTFNEMKDEKARIHNGAQGNQTRFSQTRQENPTKRKNTRNSVTYNKKMLNAPKEENAIAD